MEEVNEMAAMREAVKSVAAWLLERFGNPADPDHDKAEEFYILTTGVLAAPPRNCDVGTAEEQNERYKIYCANHRDNDNGPGAYCMKCPLNDRKNSLVMCQFLWAQMPYEAQEGGAE